jgi:hypothetical protein
MAKKLVVYTRFGDPVTIGEYGIRVREAIQRILNGSSTHADEIEIFKVDPETYKEQKETLKQRELAIKATAKVEPRTRENSRIARLYDRVNLEVIAEDV